MSDHYVLAAKMILPFALMLGLCGILGLVLLVVDCWRSQREADRIDRLLKQSGAPLTATPTRTSPDAPAPKPRGARATYFASRCTVNPTFPQTHNPQTR